MHLRTELPRALLASALALALSGVAGPAHPRNESLVAAMLYSEQGHVAPAEALLLQLAQAGQVPAMERLAPMHWYGPVLFPGGPWKREVAVLWFACAAERGSAVGTHLLALSQCVAWQAPHKPSAADPAIATAMAHQDLVVFVSGAFNALRIDRTCRRSSASRSTATEPPRSPGSPEASGLAPMPALRAPTDKVGLVNAVLSFPIHARLAGERPCI